MVVIKKKYMAVLLGHYRGVNTMDRFNCMYNICDSPFHTYPDESLSLLALLHQACNLKKELSNFLSNGYLSLQ